MQYKSIQNLQTLQGYIFRILQHFATKLCNNLLILALSSCGHLFASWPDFEGRCGEVCTSPENFCTSPERSCTSTWESFNDGTK
jgi:hypothetical protein